MSFDPPDKNKVFREEQGFPYRLLSDVDHAVGRLYGTRRPDDDPWHMLAKRMTFLIDPAGVVRRVYEVQDVASHPEVVLGDILSGAAH